MLVLPFAKAAPRYLCRLRTKAISLVRGGWVDTPYQTLTEGNTNILWEPLHEVKAAEPSMWSDVGWD